MSNRTFERAVLDWLEDGSDRTPPSAIDAVLLAVKTTPQDRGPWLPWRFRLMPALTRATGIAAVALVAAVGVGGLMYVNSNGPGGPGGPTTPPATTAAPTMAPTLQPGIPGWTSYTSTQYGFTMAIPSDWRVLGRASTKWSAELAAIDSFPYAEIFVNPELKEDDQVGLQVWRMPAPAAIYSLSDGALFAELCETIGLQGLCGGSMLAPRELCLGALGLVESQDGCLRTLISRGDGQPFAFVIDDERRVVTVFWVPREDDFPAAAKYGGTEALLMAIVGQLKVE